MTALSEEFAFEINVPGNLFYILVLYTFINLCILTFWEKKTSQALSWMKTGKSNPVSKKIFFKKYS